jgi:hypothetical protein
VPKTLSSPGYDKIQHFTYCVKERYNTSKLVTDAAQYIAEAYDLINGGVGMILYQIWKLII